MKLETVVNEVLRICRSERNYMLVAGENYDESTEQLVRAWRDALYRAREDSFPQ